MKCSKKLFPVLFLLGALFLAIVSKIFLIDFLRVSGVSMEPTIRNNQIIVVNRMHYGLPVPFGAKLAVQWKEPEAGDVVLYKYNGKNIVKRCVATEGTHLAYSLDSGYNLIVGEKTYPLTETQYHYMYLSTIVPEGTVLCIGDNANASIDSRNYGFVPVNNIIGKVKCK